MILYTPLTIIMITAANVILIYYYAKEWLTNRKKIAKKRINRNDYGYIFGFLQP